MPARTRFIPSQPKWSMAMEVNRFAVINRPLKAPAPTLSTKSRPANTATAPAMPPSAPHHGTRATSARVGSGVGRSRNTNRNTRATGTNDTVAASQGFTRAPRSCALSTTPTAWSEPATRMNG